MYRIVHYSNLCKSLHETQSVLTARKTGQTPLKDLWLKKMELENRLRMVREIEKLKVTLATIATEMRILLMIYLLTVVEYSPYGTADDATEALSNCCDKPQSSDFQHVQ